MNKDQAVNYVKNKMIAIDDKDKQFWLLITDVPRVPTPMQYVCFVVNVIIPGKFELVLIISIILGSGTMIASCFGERWSKTLFFVGVFQLFLAYILVGWLFSIYWGMLIVRKTWDDKTEVQKFLDSTKMRSDEEAPTGANQNKYPR